MSDFFCLAERGNFPIRQQTIESYRNVKRHFYEALFLYAKPTLFEKTLMELGIEYKRIKPYTPRHNGKVERSHGKDQLYFYNGRTFFNLNDLETQVARRMYEYNRFPMKPLGYLSPIEFLDNYNKTH